MHKKFLFDTNALSALTREQNDGHEKILSKVTFLDDSDELYTSILSLYEMEYGIKHSKEQNIIDEMNIAVQDVKDEFQIVSLTENGAKIFASIKEQYRIQKIIGKKALIKHNVDLMIAATAIDIGAILITNDTKDKIPNIIKSFRTDFEWADWTK
ncbi:MAG: type II toxin-antitoxin system VapC family toxin [Thiomargarita sp.]|nr:type II toxin-antitoxin system VapC family toxin [Thiomargarita sp.]